MIPLALFLHLHQPPTQFPEVLRLVFQQSYQPLLAFLLENRQARLTLNITASLLEQLVGWGRGEWVEKLRKLVLSGQVELTGTGAYHPLLPKLPETEAIRQIKLEELTLARFFPRSDLRGEGRTFKGFFPPEMAVDEGVVELVGALGYRWVVVDEAAVAEGGRRTYEGGSNEEERTGGQRRGGVFRLKGSSLKLVVRSKELSLKIAFGQIRTRGEFEENLKSYFLNHTSPLVVALDGETFGHHHPELLPWLGELLANSGKGKYRLVTASGLVRENPSSGSVKIRASTWSDGWERWDNPDNPIHQKQWQLTNLAIRAVNESAFKYEVGSRKSDLDHNSYFLLPTSDFRNLSPGQRQWLRARQLLDRALHSDQYWWASARPNWHYKMVERGARMQKNVILSVPDAPKRYVLGAISLYNEITSLGLEKYGDTVIA